MNEAGVCKDNACSGKAQRVHGCTEGVGGPA